ncbi:ABC transporter permease [Patulibacter sp.]|uniref:ABC transporter permease n=1 Tax=Patulibacter sp. TaxID=1912859 RepID=UPI00271FA2BB|nr:ABC transporter permease [Patulibacter sp.]MDO9409016.1 ABC transporter permease [Patulibacter sp.]
MNSLALYLLRRLAAAVLVVLVVSFLIFCCLYLAPGSPEQAILGPQQATPEALATIRSDFGLDDSFVLQYWHFLDGLLHLDLGRSFQTGESVGSGITSRLGVTVPLALGGFLVACVLGIGGGIIAAQRRGRMSDRALGTLGVVAASTPAYASGVLFLYVFGVALGWFPVSGSGDGLSDRAFHLVLPIVTLGLVGAASMFRRTRVAVVSALERDDVAFARARGLSSREVLQKYVLRHAMVMIATSAGVILIFMLAGAAVVESTFDLDGVGSYLLTSINDKDLPSVQGIAVVTTALVVLINLAMDLLYAVIDPRIQRGAAAD